MFIVLKGKNPAIAICGIVERYQRNDGIPLGYLVDWHRVRNSSFLFFPATPPNTSEGSAIRAHVRVIAAIAAKGNAEAELCKIATVLRKQNTKSRGPQKSKPVTSKVLTCSGK